MNVRTNIKIIAVIVSEKSHCSHIGTAERNPRIVQLFVDSFFFEFHGRKSGELLELTAEIVLAAVSDDVRYFADFIHIGFKQFNGSGHSDLFDVLHGSYSVCLPELISEIHFTDI